MKILRQISFSLLLVMVAVLCTATIIEKYYGTLFVRQHLYDSFPFLILWGRIALSGL